MSELVKIDSEVLENNKAQEMNNLYQPILVFYTEQENKANELINTPLSKSVAQECYALRQELKTKRLASQKELKPFVEQANRLLKATKSITVNVDYLSKGIEDKLLQVENAQAEIDRQAKEKILNERTEKLKEIGLEVMPSDLGKLSKVAFINLLNTTKATIEAKKEADAKAEAERIERERIEAEEKKRLQEENERLKKEVEEREAKAKAKKLEEERRMSLLHKAGLSFNGTDFIYKDVNVNWVEVVAMSDSEYTDLMIGITGRMEEIKKEEQEAKKLEDDRLEKERLEKKELQDKLNALEKEKADRELEEQARIEEQQAKEQAIKDKAAQEKKAIEEAKKLEEDNKKKEADSILKAQDFKKFTEMETQLNEVLNSYSFNHSAFKIVHEEIKEVIVIKKFELE